NVTGLSLEPPTQPSLFEQLQLARRLNHRIGDIRDAKVVARVVAEVDPDFTFHLAAQPLVRDSYRIPVETFATNVMGTVHVLDALRQLDHERPRPRVVVCITTDKCYENREWLHAYREEDPMGGFDPYSASKGAAEIAIAAYRRSYTQSSNPPTLAIASALAGNVIGGGDWARDRIIPDCIRALQSGDAIPVRNKVATRPWQHVLEPLSGYLRLAEYLARGIGLAGEPLPPGRSLVDYAGAFNFGPALTSNRSVAELVQEVLINWPGQWEDASDPNAPHEASKLNLTIDKAFHLLEWQPRWDFAETVRQTVQWYREVLAGADPTKFTQSQIAEYCGMEEPAYRRARH
ncbi:MAG: CDP-glucose 4,6-dehydratase, partial [Opitutales bacterium]